VANRNQLTSQCFKGLMNNTYFYLMFQHFRVIMTYWNEIITFKRGVLSLTPFFGANPWTLAQTHHPIVWCI